ncbi:MAG: hypothetical protein KIT11_11730 [Fimbriimonadaceae bacterium]|nr:hypothetical protein [Fimbriimonadaceae bacterium]QYK55296.1 MAG: hypothetical protein KF733_09805 [Fimbriimonadaceae bacterium]
MHRVVSVSLGTSKRDKSFETEILGEPFLIERIGTNGDRERFRALFRELDGKVDALGVGGADIWLVSGEKRYAFREVQDLVSGAKTTPVVDGSGLKHTLEREAVKLMTEVIDWPRERVLLVSGVDRFGMAQALEASGAKVVYGDLLFGLGLPIPIRSYSALERLANVLLPIVTRLPIQWFYPTGEKQEKRTPKHKKWFDWATVVAGDWHYIRRYAPDQMPGKTVLTQTIRSADLDWLRSCGVARVVATTPVMGGETFATNVMEGVLLTLLGKRPETATPEDYLGILGRLGWAPTMITLTDPSPR